MVEVCDVCEALCELLQAADGGLFSSSSGSIDLSVLQATDSVIISVGIGVRLLLL